VAKHNDNTKNTHKHVVESGSPDVLRVFGLEPPEASLLIFLELFSLALSLQQVACQSCCARRASVHLAAGQGGAWLWRSAFLR
jgi:hypothetical protein